MTDFIAWARAAGVRALKTAAQTAVAQIGANTVGVTELDWAVILGVSATAGIVSLLTSVAGLPELAAADPVEVTDVSKVGKHAKGAGE